MIDEITEASFREAAAELREAGFSKAEEIEERILHTGGYAKLQ